MNLAQFFDLDLIDIELKAQTKGQAIETLAELFCKKYPDKDKKTILDAVAEREELGSTSFGRGFAFPHARTDAVSDLHIVLGISRKGLDDKSPDNVPLKAVCLLLTPRNISKLYLQTLSGLANLARRPGMLDSLASVRTPMELLDIVEKADIEIKRALTAGDVMSQDLVTVGPEEALKTVANLMFKHKYDGIPVVDDQGKLLGEISGRELIRSALASYENLISDVAALAQMEPFDELLRRQNQIRVKHIMRREIGVVSEQDPLANIAAMMLSKNVERIMVVRGEKLVGIITSTDIISKIVRG